VAARYTSAIAQLISPNPTGPDGLRLIRVPASLAVDAKLAFKANDHLTISIAGENLTGAAGADLSPLPAERRLRTTLRVGF
jgi:outer membrane receptor for ferrienterochelin and colicins